LSPLGLLYTFSSFPGVLWLSKGKIRLRIVWALFMFATVIIAVFAGLPFGLKGICIALVIRGLICFPIILAVTYRVIGLRPYIYLKGLSPAVVSGFVALVFTLLLSKLFPGSSFSRNIWMLAGGSIAGLALYVIIHMVFFKNTFRSFRETVVSLRRGFL
jgi:hypothetical protein